MFLKIDERFIALVLDADPVSDHMDAESLCRPYYPIKDTTLFDRANKASFGSLVALHFLLAASYTLHLCTRWSSVYAKWPSSETSLPPRGIAGTTNANIEGGAAAPSEVSNLATDGLVLPFAKRVHKKMLIFTVANIVSNVIIGLSWLFWMLGNVLLSDSAVEGNDTILSGANIERLNASGKMNCAFFALFPAGMLCFVISVFAFSDRFVALCIYQNPKSPHVRLLSRRYMWMTVILFLAIAVSGWTTLGFQVSVSNLQRECFEDRSFANVLVSVSSGILHSFDYNCAIAGENSTAFNDCNSCNREICLIQDKAAVAFIAFLVFYLFAVSLSLISALRIWMQVSRQLPMFVSGILKLWRWKVDARQSVEDHHSAAEQRVMSKPLLVVWIGLLLMILALAQRLSILVIWMFESRDSCDLNNIITCGPCDVSCRSTSEVLANWIVLDPFVLPFSSMAAELLNSFIMGAIMLWLTTKSRAGTLIRMSRTSANRKEKVSGEKAEMNSWLEHSSEGRDLALEMSLDIRRLKT